MSEHVLDIELGYFDQNREEWCKHHNGKFVLIKGITVQGFYDTIDKAYQVGCQTWGAVPFLVKEVALEDKIISMLDRTVIKVREGDQDEHPIV